MLISKTHNIHIKKIHIYQKYEHGDKMKERVSHMNILRRPFQLEQGRPRGLSNTTLLLKCGFFLLYQID